MYIYTLFIYRYMCNFSTIFHFRQTRITPHPNMGVHPPALMMHIAYSTLFPQNL